MIIFYLRIEEFLKRSPKILKAAQDSNTLADIDDTRGNTATRASALIYDIDHLEYIEVRKPSGELVCMFKFDLKWKCDTDRPCRVGSCTNGACSVVSAFTYDQTNLEPVLEKCSNLQDTIQMETTPLYSWKRVRNFRVQGDDAYADDDYTNCNLVTNPLQCLYGGGNLEGAKLRKNGILAELS